MDPRFRRFVINVRPAIERDTAPIRSLWRDSGEGNVDFRDIEEAILSRQLHVFQYGEEVVATGGIYPYADAAFSELGSSCWHPIYRGLGGAQASVDLRTVLASLYEPGTLVTSELYDSSTKSARVLLRQGMEELFLIPLPMLEHAYDANPLKSVHQWVFSPWRVPHCAKRLLRLIGGHPASNNPVAPSFEFSPAYGFENPALRKALERLAGGDMGVIGHEDEAPETMEQWVAENFPSQVLTQEMFMALRTRPH